MKAFIIYERLSIKHAAIAHSEEPCAGKPHDTDSEAFKPPNENFRQLTFKMTYSLISVPAVAFIYYQQYALYHQDCWFPIYFCAMAWTWQLLVQNMSIFRRFKVSPDITCITTWNYKCQASCWSAASHFNSNVRPCRFGLAISLYIMKVVTI